MIVSGVHCTSAEQVFISAPVLDSRFSSSSRSSSRPIKPKIMDSLVFCQDLIKFLGKFVNMRSPTKQANLEDTHCKPRGWQFGIPPSCKHLDERGLIPSHSASRVRLLLGVSGVKWGIFPLHLNLYCQWGELLHKGFYLGPNSPSQHMPMECCKIRIKS